MRLILAIESDRRQAARISALARELHVELLVADSTERALQTLAERTPDLILTPHLLSSKDEAALNERLRELDTAGSHVQTLVIPVLSSSRRLAVKWDGGLLNRLRGTRDDGPSEGGCDPAVFAAQIAEYLQRAAEDRAALATLAEDERTIAEDDRVYHASLLEAPPAAPERVEGGPTEFQLAEPEFPDAPVVTIVDDSALFQLVEPEFPDAPIVTIVDDSALASVVEEPAVDERFLLFASDVEDAAMMAAEAPTAMVAQPTASLQEAVAPGFEDFVDFIEFEELAVLDTPSIAFGEWTAAAERIEPEGFEPETGLDALEILAEPEILAGFDFQSEGRLEHPERRASAIAPGLPDEPEPDPRASHFEFEADLWMALPAAAHPQWPALQGPSVKANATPAFDAPPDAGVVFAPAPDPHGRVSGKKGSKGAKPVQDEWGFFDPVQCGFAALLAKLDEVTDKDEASPEPTTSRT